MLRPADFCRSIVFPYLYGVCSLVANAPIQGLVDGVSPFLDSFWGPRAGGFDGAGGVRETALAALRNNREREFRSATQNDGPGCGGMEFITVGGCEDDLAGNRSLFAMLATIRAVKICGLAFLAIHRSLLIASNDGRLVFTRVG